MSVKDRSGDKLNFLSRFTIKAIKRLKKDEDNLIQSNIEDELCFPWLLSLVMENKELDEDIVMLILELLEEIIKIFSEAKWDKLI